MTYTVKFRDDALREWLRLDKAIQQQFAKKLKKCSENPHIASAKLRGLKDCGNDSNLLIVFYVQIMPDDFVMQLHRF